MRRSTLATFRGRRGNPDGGGQDCWVVLWGALRKAALAEKLLLVESDVLAFFQESGEDAPERMNSVLPEYVEQQRKRA